jgi:MFS transporter, FHS family, L-fucose permease
MTAAKANAVKTNYPIVLLVFLVFFVISLITNILGPLIPDIIKSFTLSLGMAGFLPFSFFVAYAVMSIPSGMLLERYGGKLVIGGAFLLAFAGSLAFAMVPDFRTALASLFVIGAGMATLQVAINPLLRVAGGDAHFAFYSVMAQLVFGLASFISPQIYSYLVGRLADRAGGGGAILNALAAVVPPTLPWISLYWMFTVVTLLMVVVIAVAPLPRVELKEDERAGVMSTYASLLRERYVLLYALAIFCYVGMEQGVANWISQFLQTYHGFDPQTTGATAVSRFWGLMTAGCLLGLILLKLMDSRKVLVIAAVGAMASLTAALFGTAQVALAAFPLVGFCASVMWSIIFSLALNSAREHHGSFSGILCTAVVGGAVVPLVIGWLGDLSGLRNGMMLLYVPLAYILSVGMWARPLVTNATISLRKKESARI